MPWLDSLFKFVVDNGASDLHLSSKVRPIMRKDGLMRAVEGYDELAPDELMGRLMEIAPPKFRAEFESEWDTDFAYEIPGVGRFRCNYFVDANGPGGVFRVIPSRVPTVGELNLSPAIVELCSLRKGLILVTGPTGSGKSTTLAAMINHINETRHDHIVTIEDPIEFIYSNKNCLVNQREVHRHTKGFKHALRAVLREDPDVVLVGEMRDLETIEMALETAETGHLVLATLHTNTAATTVDRVIDQFPSGQQNQIRTMLASCLKAVIAQTLCRRMTSGRIAALEVLIVNAAAASNIRESKTHQLPSTMQVSQSIGMRMLNDALMEHVKNKIVEPAEAYSHAVDKKDFASKLKEAKISLDYRKIPLS